MTRLLAIWRGAVLWLVAIAVAPRHNEIKPGTARAICKDLEIAAPTFR